MFFNGFLSVPRERPANKKRSAQCCCCLQYSTYCIEPTVDTYCITHVKDVFFFFLPKPCSVYFIYGGVRPRYTRVKQKNK